VVAAGRLTATDILLPALVLAVGISFLRNGRRRLRAGRPQGNAKQVADAGKVITIVGAIMLVLLVVALIVRR